jgi:hypothetical protein
MTNINKRLKRDIVISVLEGRGDLVGIYREDRPRELLLECSPKRADKIIKIWNEIVAIQK